ncbi:unnamed protein product [Linum trigynum]|uniref:C2H2-type domain-containing protein n=1 Tax=Linum trigynum TaxID=586398 RepID=A0AAV2FIS7_9ROSI
MAFFGGSNSISFNSTPESIAPNQDSIDSCTNDPLLTLGLACSSTPTTIPLGEREHSCTFIPGQFGVNKRVTKVKKTYVTAYRPGPHNHMIAPPDILNQNSLPEGFVVTKKIEKTVEYFFPSPPISTHHHLHFTNASHHPQTSSTHDYNSPPPHHHVQPHQPNYPKTSINTTPNTMNHPFTSSKHFVPHTETHPTHPNQSKPHGKDSVVILDVDDEFVPLISDDDDVNYFDSDDDFADYMGENEHSIDDDDEMIHRSNPGRTHSLPHRKHGPYGCPRCNEVLPTPQAFAAHARGHYKNESKEERDERLAARKRRSGFAFVGSSSSSGDGPTTTTTMLPAGKYMAWNDYDPHIPPVIRNITGKEWREIQSMEGASSSQADDLDEP